MKRILMFFTLWLAILCGCQTSSRVANPSEDVGKLSFQVKIPEYDLRTDLGSARIYVDGSFAGNFVEGSLIQLPRGKHKIAVLIAQAAEVRRQNDGKTIVRNFRLNGEETVMVFGGQSIQNVLFDLSNLKRTEIDSEDSR